MLFCVATSRRCTIEWHQAPIPLLSTEQAQAYLTAGQFGAGSMSPKVGAAVEFVLGSGSTSSSSGGGGSIIRRLRRRVAHICDPQSIFDAVTSPPGAAVGTRVVVAAEWRW